MPIRRARCAVACALRRALLRHEPRLYFILVLAGICRWHSTHDNNTSLHLCIKYAAQVHTSLRNVTCLRAAPH